MTTLFICEKPSQARDIARNLGATRRGNGFIQGDGVTVTWCLGHLLELKPPGDYCKDLKPWRMSVLPIIPEKWKMDIKDRTKDQFKAIKECLKTATKVVVATDADREGDVIGREVLDHCKYKGEVERLWLSALDDASIKKGLSNIKPGSSTYNLYQAGLGRGRADWIVGMNASMAMSCLFGERGKGVLSVGRVQTPTLNLIVERDREIENFTAKDYFELYAFFNDGEVSFKTKWDAPEDYTDEEGRCLKHETIQNVVDKIKDQTGQVTKFEDKDKRTSPPLCFSLSDLQKMASSKYGYGAKETLEIAQALYERHKATTYPRTDCGYLPTEQFSAVPQVMKAVVAVDPKLKELIDVCDMTAKSPTWNDKKITAHHGIIPTMNEKVALHTMSDKEFKLYDLIRRYYIAQFLGDYQYSNRKVTVGCKDETFQATCNTPKVQGWKRAIAKEMEDDDVKEEPESLIPDLKKGQDVDCVDTEIASKKTKPPARFTEGTLITAMKHIAKYVDLSEHKKTLKETAGIGTEATRANIIETLLTREYIVKNKKQLISTDKGRHVIDLAPSPLKDPVTTAIWEQALDDVSTGKGDLATFLVNQKQVLLEMLSGLAALSDQKIEASGVKQYKCSACGERMRQVSGKFSVFWSCSAYPSCNHKMKDVNGKPVEKQKAELSNHGCATCDNGKMVKRVGQHGPWWGCNQYPKCKQTCSDNNGVPAKFKKEVVS